MNDDNFRVSALSPEMIKNLEAKRSWVYGHYIENGEELYQSLEGKLNLLNAIIENKWIDKSETLKLQCLGITFGDALIQHLEGLKWVEYFDEYGTDPALRFHETDFFIFPQTMISKRIEDGIEVNIYSLFEDSVKAILGHFESVYKPV
ncbi:DUF3806 domain-containing protein [Sebaldella sp. S0638]|uniref:DUF3806 domain-containing protein n=1 Tax=Sebaldella sp. S0638 TaxID=2957809 RepID=UPI00209D0D23|nr:DUF3806 domain-containing protein [Sebaldella sp. S0638]MCP1225106.1 DUF3806 domain-containing protein [Sebaldella sp. S0638]